MTDASPISSDKERRALAKVFCSLRLPESIRIIEILAEAGHPVPPGQLIERLQLDASKVSRLLKELESAQLIRRPVIEGRPHAELVPGLLGHLASRLGGLFHLATGGSEATQASDAPAPSPPAKGAPLKPTGKPARRRYRE